MVKAELFTGTEHQVQRDGKLYVVLEKENGEIHDWFIAYPFTDEDWEISERKRYEEYKKECPFKKGMLDKYGFGFSEEKIRAYEGMTDEDWEEYQIKRYEEYKNEDPYLKRIMDKHGYGYSEPK